MQKNSFMPFEKDADGDEDSGDEDTNVDDLDYGWDAGLEPEILDNEEIYDEVTVVGMASDDEQLLPFTDSQSSLEKCRNAARVLVTLLPDIQTSLWCSSVCGSSYQLCKY